MIEIVSAAYAGWRIDSFVAELTELSRSGAQKLIESGDITVSGVPVSKKYTLKLGDEVDINIPEPEMCEAVPEDIPLNIVYEDDDIIVINKPSGMVVHPAPGNYTGTLVNALLWHCRDLLSGIGGVMRPGIVHRIDKDTSGLLVVAKNDAAHKALSEQLEHHGIVREYHALVRGGFNVDSGTVNAPIGRHPVDRKKMAVLLAPDAHAKEAITHYEVMERYGEMTYLRLLLETGRTHQIRVHMAHIDHPLYGDDIYGKECEVRTLLHCSQMEFTHPETKKKMCIKAHLPKDFWLR